MKKKLFVLLFLCFLSINAFCLGTWLPYDDMGDYGISGFQASVTPSYYLILEGYTTNSNYTFEETEAIVLTGSRPFDIVYEDLQVRMVPRGAPCDTASGDIFSYATPTSGTQINIDNNTFLARTDQTPPYFYCSTTIMPTSTSIWNVNSLGYYEFNIESVFASFDCDVYSDNSLGSVDTTWSPPDYTNWIDLQFPGAVRNGVNYEVMLSQLEQYEDENGIPQQGISFNNINEIVSFELNGQLIQAVTSMENLWQGSNSYENPIADSYNSGAISETNNYTGYVNIDVPLNCFITGINEYVINYRYYDSDLEVLVPGQDTFNFILWGTVPDYIIGNNVVDSVVNAFNPDNLPYSDPQNATEVGANIIQKILNAITAPFNLFANLFNSLFDTVSGFFAFFGQVFSFLPPQILMIVMFGLSLTLVLRILGR